MLWRMREASRVSRIHVTVFNAFDDNVLDGMDAFEAAVKAALKAKPAPAKSAAARKTSAIDPAEVGQVRLCRHSCALTRSAPTCQSDAAVQGTDALLQTILDEHDKPGDKCLVYCMRNVFFVEGQYEPSLRALVVRWGSLRRQGPPPRRITPSFLAPGPSTGAEAAILHCRRREWRRHLIPQAVLSR
jgi:hypothetical protein